METIRTARLELVPLSASFVDSVKRGDLLAASREVGATVSLWLAANSAHLVQLHLAQTAADAEGAGPLGRVIVVDASTERRVIGSIGFHGLPDDRGRLEIGCAIDPADQGEGYAAEAMTALIEWATERYEISRVLIAIPARPYRPEPAPIEIWSDPMSFIGPATTLDDQQRIDACQGGHAGSAATRSSRSSATTGETRRRTSPPGALRACDPRRKS